MQVHVLSSNTHLNLVATHGDGHCEVSISRTPPNPNQVGRGEMDPVHVISALRSLATSIETDPGFGIAPKVGSGPHTALMRVGVADAFPRFHMDFKALSWKVREMDPAAAEMFAVENSVMGCLFDLHLKGLGCEITTPLPIPLAEQLSAFLMDAVAGKHPGIVRLTIAAGTPPKVEAVPAVPAKDLAFNSSPGNNIIEAALLKDPKAETSALAMYAVAARDVSDFAEMLAEATRPAVEILYLMVTTPNDNQTEDNKELNSMIAARVARQVEELRGMKEAHEY